MSLFGFNCNCNCNCNYCNYIGRAVIFAYAGGFGLLVWVGAVVCSFGWDELGYGAGLFALALAGQVLLRGSGFGWLCWGSAVFCAVMVGSFLGWAAAALVVSRGLLVGLLVGAAETCC